MSQDKYKARMMRKKAHIDKRVAQANIDKGVIVVLTGNGKGKSSSAFGMILRALGHGMQVALVKFLKGDIPSGEDSFFQSHPNIRLTTMKSGFTWDTQDREQDRQKAKEAWQVAVEHLSDPKIDLVVLDEITYMLNYQYLNAQGVYETINNKPEGQHVIITGRAVSNELIEIANTVSEVKDIKHAFNQDIRAQKGVDL